MAKKLFLHVLNIFLFSVAFSAHAAVIDFEGLMHADAGIDDYSTPYLEAGYVLENLNLASGSGSAFGVLGTLHSNFSDSTSMFNRSTNGVTKLTMEGGGVFNLFSIDLAELTSPSTPSITFEGFFSGGGSITDTFDLDGNAFGAETFSFTGFTNLTNVTWGTESHQFDNIVVSAIPIPPAVWLFGSGLIGLIGIARRRA